jgi:glycosyltransferase involved in cell wall biosynthesis
VSSPPRVLFVCADPVGAEMAGLGIRNWELARALSDRARVTIAHGGRESISEGPIRTIPFRPHDPRAVIGLLADTDVVVAHPQWPRLTRALRRSSAQVVFDLYDPETLETLELLAGRRRFARAQLTATTLDRLHDALRSGHHFMCASESQRDLWLGAILGLRMIDPSVYDRDPGYRSVIDVVPFGIPDVPPARDGGPGPRELLPGLAADAELVLWNGGIWQWLDASTAIRAIDALRRRRSRAVLVFMGGAGRHPAAQQSAAAARALADELGLLGTGVIFNDRWVPYAERSRWLIEADCAVAAAHDHLETRFAFRTRLLDCLWAGLPVACTTGDELAARVAREDLGAVAGPGDSDGLAAAIERILDNGRAAYAPQLRAAAQRSMWSHAAQPLIRWVHETSSAESGRPPASSAALRPPVAQVARRLAYETLGRRLLNRRG